MFHFFESRIDPFADGGEEQPAGTVLGYLCAQLAPYRSWLPWIMLVGLITALVESGLIFYSGRLIDLMTVSGPEAFWADHGMEVCLIVIGVLVLRPAIVTLNHLLLEQTLSSNMQEQARWRAHKHLLDQSVGFFQKDFAGRLSNRVMQMGPTVQDSVHMAFEGLWFSVTYVIGAIVILSQIDPRLSLPLAIWVLGYAFYVRYIARHVGVAAERWADARSLTTGRVVDAYSNIETVKLFAHEHQEQDYALSAMKRLRLRFQRFLRLMTLLALGLNAINGVLIFIVVGPAVWLWTEGIVSIGEVAAAAALTIRLNGMSSWIMWVTIRLFENYGVIRESLRSLTAPVDLKDATDAKPLDHGLGQIRFQQVSHRYGKENASLKGIDLTIPEGQKLGLVGRSGAGKTTLVNLLMRFHDPEKGRIFFGDQPIDSYTQSSLRQQIGMVSQNTSLLHRSIRDNILYGNRAASEARMIDAAKRANAHDFIQSLQDGEGRRGYDAYVGERGVSLSGGQRQRIAIARVILKDAPILILDEATSALDSRVEASILDALYKVMEGKTVIAIAHRLSTIAQMDRIVVMEKGRFVEEGTHEQLVDAGGLYAELWQRQSGRHVDAEFGAIQQAALVQAF